MPRTLFATGTSSGIGRATAMLFHERGWNVVATMRSPEKENELNKLANVRVAYTDVTAEASIRSAISEGISAFGHIDVLLNNAGYGAYGLIEATPTEHMRKEFETNVIGMLAAVKAMVPHFRERGSGMIVNISSMGGQVAMPLGSLYHGSKFAVEGATEALQYEMAAIGVAVKLIEPGMTRSNFAGRSFQFNDDEKLIEYRDIVAKTMAAFERVNKDAGEAQSVAATIYRAVTDGSEQLRYPSGPDAEALLQARKSEDDASFTGRIRNLFGLSAPAPRQ